MGLWVWQKKFNVSLRRKQGRLEKKSSALSHWSLQHSRRKSLFRLGSLSEDRLSLLRNYQVLIPLAMLDAVRFCKIHVFLSNCFAQPFTCRLNVKCFNVQEVEINPIKYGWTSTYYAPALYLLNFLPVHMRKWYNYAHVNSARELYE